MATQKPGRGYSLREIHSLIPGWKWGIYRVGERAVLSFHATKRDGEVALRKLRRSERLGHSKNIRTMRHLAHEGMSGKRTSHRAPPTLKPPTAAARQRIAAARKREEAIRKAVAQGRFGRTRAIRARGMAKYLQLGGGEKLSASQRADALRKPSREDRRKLPPDRN